jgi:tetratricopeptide (TPR) repeat protein
MGSVKQGNPGSVTVVQQQHSALEQKDEIAILWGAVIRHYWRDMVLSNVHRHAIILLCTLIAAPATHSQTPDMVAKFRLAQGYEQAGDCERAVPHYEELTGRDPGNYAYFDGLRRCYMQLKRYDDAVALIQRRLLNAPTDVNLRGLLGSALYKGGREKEAYLEWDRAIAADSTNVNTYRMIANLLLENRLLDKTAELYRRARVALKDPALFTIDLAQLLAVSMDFRGATTEYLNWLKQNPAQLTFVQNRMAAFTGREEGRRDALDVVRAELARQEDPRLYELLGWLHLEGRDFESAYAVYRRIESLTNSQGTSIYNFAERAYKEGAYAVAARAYREAIGVPVHASRLPFAKYGYASSIKELSVRADTLPGGGGGSVFQDMPATESQPTYTGAIALFRSIINEYPRSEFSARSYYQIGTLLFERYFDLDGALNAFESVEKELPANHSIIHDVSLNIGEVLTAKGDTSAAARRYLKVAEAPNATPDQQDEAGYRLAELEYFGGSFTSALERLQHISFNLKANYANDAIELAAFLQENKHTAEAALKQYARAHFLARQRKNSEAIPLFLDVIEKNPQALLVDDALMKVASLQTQARLFGDAIASYERLLSEFKETSIALDRAQFQIGEIYQHGLQAPAQAIAAYEKVLINHPHSLLTTEARKRIRDLRGDTL